MMKKPGKLTANQGRSLDRASFVNLLSQYLKEKRNLGDFSVGISSKPDAKERKKVLREFKTKSLVTYIKCEAADSSRQLWCHGSKEDTITDSSQGKQECSADHIFQWPSGVYNDFPPDKVKEIMALANQGSSTTCTDDTSVEQRQYGGSDLQIAREGIHFTVLREEKRQGGCRAPYQSNNNRVSLPPSNPTETSRRARKVDHQKTHPRGMISIYSLYREFNML
ncbi:hypothetical protein F3Y22_tig00004159pilonHSYRG00022 [Hibiscus syriacus]|uniref:Uncharacterized protein n=1 Tax=Hibiscus syriacus TaxID=106335 RepID=A0A6A3CLY6_HIBSY|nr:hypothetical protein F3Y22_tig00004159pilonHSYRG00022 [Hibiscus syriacus]